MPSSTIDAEIAVAVAVAVAAGWKGAELARARRDVDAVKSGLGRAREVMREAFVAFVVVLVVAALVVNWWLRAKH